MVTTAATDRPDSVPTPLDREVVRSLLARLRRRLRLQMALETVMEVAAALAMAGLVLVALDWWFRLGPTSRLVLLAIVAVGLIVFLGGRALRRWRASRLDDLSLAMTLDRFRPGTGGRITDVIQLPDLLDGPASSASPALVRLAVHRAGEALAASDWSTLWNRGRTGRRAAVLTAALLVPALFATLAPAAARLSAARWLLGSSERWPQRTYLSVAGLGDRDGLIAPRDEPITIEVRADLPEVEPRDGHWFVLGRGEPLPLRSKPEAPAPPANVRIRERLADGSVRDSLMVATGPSTFRHELPPSSASSTIELVGGDDWLGPVAIRRVDRPSVAEILLRARDPGAVAEGDPDGPSFRQVDDRQHPVFLQDTEVELGIVGSEPIAEARLDIHPGEPPPLDRDDERTFSGRWTLREAVTVEVRLVSGETGLTSKPTFLSIGLLRDRVPRATLRAMGVGARVTAVATIPLSLAATDDLGLAAVRLVAERTTFADEQAVPRTDRKDVPISIGAGEDRTVLDHQARHDVELQADPPEVGTILRFIAEAEDLCAQGAQVGRSGVLQMQVVSPDELFYEVLIRQRAERSKFVSALEATEALGEALTGDPKPEDVTAVLRRLHTTSRQLEQIASRIADSLLEMTLNQIGSPKSHRLLREGVIDPINALNAGSVEELRGVLQYLAGQGRRAGADAETARRLHAEVVAEMAVILEQMSQWESFVDVVNQVAEVIKIQQGVLKATEGARDSHTEEVFDALP